MKEYIIKFAMENYFSGDISIFKNQRTIFHESFGYRDINNKYLNNKNTRFGIASGTKTFTSLGILKMIDAGLIKLTTTIKDIFGRELGFIDSTATIKDLLIHTSGIYDYYDEELIKDFDNYTVSIPCYQLEIPSDYPPLFETNQPKFKPGERPSYSNGGYVFLGIIIEKLTGLTYRQFMDKNLFAQLEMNNTGFYAFNSLPENTAFGYILKDSSYVSNIYQLPIRGGGDGGLYTNSNDMQKFWTKLFSSNFISENFFKEFTAKQVEIFKNQDYGLGVYISQCNDKNSLFAAGCDAGVGFYSTYVPESGLNINILSNMTNGHKNIFDYIRKDSSEIISA